jgi:hypothetical protein
MDAKVRLSDIRDGMEMQSDEMPSYLHRPTGRVINISDEAMQAAKDGDEEFVEPEELADARGMAVFGYSRSPAASRDASRMRGFLGGGLTAADGDSVDKGHFVGHSLGGGTDVNLFPQRSELKRGWSDPGKVFRRMERAAAGRPGTFVFARPLYSDTTWHPTALEYGLLTAELCLWVERFSN